MTNKKNLLETARGVAFFMGLIGPIWAGGAPSDTLADPITFFPLGEKPGPGRVQLANGHTVVDRLDWKTIFIAEVGQQLQADGSITPITCTATMIGPGLFLTAAHCLDRGASKGLQLAASLQIGPQTMTASCTVSPEYAAAVKAKDWYGGAPRANEDYALCVFPIPTLPIATLATMSYEVIDANTIVSDSAPILLTGFGCRTINVDAAGGITFGNYDHIFTIGDAVAEKRTSAVTISISSGISEPTFCPGDSGGPLLSGATEANQTNPRRIRGVNGTVGLYSTATGAHRFRSTASALATAQFRSFAQTWLHDHTGAIACGINQAAGIPPCAR